MIKKIIKCIFIIISVLLYFGIVILGIIGLFFNKFIFVFKIFIISYFLLYLIWYLIK